MKILKFKAYIEYNIAQAREAKKFGDKNIIGQEVIFTFEDLVGKYRELMGKKMFFSPSFTARELIIPWLQKGNIPKIIYGELNENIEF